MVTKDVRMQPVIKMIDTFQQRHRLPGFVFAVFKKFGDDNGGYLAALLTYYGFLSLFPLLLVLFTVLQFAFHGNSTLEHQVTTSLNTYLPVVGQQVTSSIHSLRSAGWGLLVGILITLYGARGGADVLRFALNNIWQVPRNRRAGFPKSMIQSFTIMGGVGLGFMGGVAVSSFTSVLGHDLWVKIIANILGFLLATVTLLFVYQRATVRRVPAKDMLFGTTIAALIVQLLLTFGALLVRHQLRGANNLYGAFAIVLGLLFWIYLIAQVLVLGIEIDSVRHLKLWPRALRIEKPTEADRKAYELYADVQRFMPQEQIDVRFKK